jgi:carbonic anhydrase
MTGSGNGSPGVSRRGFMGVAGGVAAGAGLAVTGQASQSPADAATALKVAEHPAPGRQLSPRDALRLLMQGNRRWVCGDLLHPHQSVARRRAVAEHQDPFATVVSCIDSRVPPEIVFDRGIGDLFVIRTGAQALDSQVVLGSIEFGPNGYPSARLIVVLGHQRCGAVIAAISAIEGGVPAPGHIQSVVNALRPAYRVAVGQPGDLVENMVRAQVRLTVRRLQNDELIAELIAKEGLLVVGGRYDLNSGRVEIIA